MNKKWTEKVIRKIAPFTLASNKIKYFGGNSNHAGKRLYDKLFKKLKKEIQKIIRRYKERSSIIMKR